MSDNLNTHTVVSRDAGNVVLIEIFCATEKAAQDTIQLIRVQLAEGRQVRILLPNATIHEDTP